MNTVITAVRRLVAKDDGQDLLEYGLLAVLIALTVMAGVTSVGRAVMDVFWKQIGNAV